MSEQLGRKSGGPWSDRHISPQERATTDEVANYQAVPPEEQLQARSGEDRPTLVKTLIVRDGQGQVVSVTKVAPDAKFGVGVKLKPGHTVKEFEAGSLARDPVGGS